MEIMIFTNMVYLYICIGLFFLNVFNLQTSSDKTV